MKKLFTMVAASIFAFAAMADNVFEISAVDTFEVDAIGWRNPSDRDEALGYIGKGGDNFSDFIMNGELPAVGVDVNEEEHVLPVTISILQDMTGEDAIGALEYTYVIIDGGNHTIACQGFDFWGMFTVPPIMIDGGTLKLKSGRFAKAMFTDCEFAIDDLLLDGSSYTEDGDYYVVTVGGETMKKLKGSLGEVMMDGYEIGFSISSITGDTADLGDYELQYRYVFDRDVPANTLQHRIVVGSIKASGPVGAFTNGEEMVWIPFGQTVEDFLDGTCSMIAFTDISEDQVLAGAKITVSAYAVDPEDFDKEFKLGTRAYVFSEGGAVRDGERLPADGSDVVAYFTFDSDATKFANTGITASQITGLTGGAAFTPFGYEGGAILLDATNSCVTGTLANPICVPNTAAAFTEANHDFTKGWAVGFWYKPDPTTKPNGWDAIKQTIGAVGNFYDGSWHYILLCYNGGHNESANRYELSVDGDVANNWASSWYGGANDISYPFSIDAQGNFSFGGELRVKVGFMEMTLPFVGLVDEIVVLNRRASGYDARGFMKGQIAVTHLVDDVYDGTTINTWKTDSSDAKTNGLNYARGCFNINAGWSTFYPMHNHWNLAGIQGSADVPAYTNSAFLVANGDGHELIAWEHADGQSFAWPTGTFPGESLTIGIVGGEHGAFNLRNGAGARSNTVTVNDLRLNSGYIKTAAGSTRATAETLAGSVTVNATVVDPFVIHEDEYQTNQYVKWAADTIGETDAALAVIGAGYTVEFCGDLSSYKGLISADAARVNFTSDAANDFTGRVAVVNGGSVGFFASIDALAQVDAFDANGIALSGTDAVAIELSGFANIPAAVATYTLGYLPDGVDSINVTGVGTIEGYTVTTEVADGAAKLVIASSASNPTVDGNPVEPDEVFDYANSAKSIVYPSAPVVGGTAGAQTITFNSVVVDVPPYYIVTLNGNTITLTLNRDVIFGVVNGKETLLVKVAADGDDFFATTAANKTFAKLYYGLQSKSSLTTGSWQAPGSWAQCEHDGDELAIPALLANGPFYQVTVTDIVPVAE